MRAGKKALIIVDVQNDFLPPDGSLAVPQGRETLPHICKLIEDESWVKEWDLVVATQDWHPRGHISFASAHPGEKPYTKIRVSKPSKGEQMDMFIWPDHCVPGTKGAEIEEGVRERLKPWLQDGRLAIVRKGYNMHVDAFSAFEGAVVDVPDPLAASPEVGRYLADKGIDTCVIVGLATDYCVCQTCLSSLAYEVDGRKTFKTLVYTPAVRGVSEQDSAKALEEMKGRGAILVGDEQALLQALKG
ncbi:hypothetical protein NliqN6_3281 [Naganishia liquefaciens]|uniref:nicotinamidase n=1 Tax=Naganishia liquefaciens TaxID=104408 RepID=A0A8H3TTR1_9TREE|nr:hypothetical protein NliqN6_3281 [Naganishia liquefaciens]